jgi:hypothetical protein
MSIDDDDRELVRFERLSSAAFSEIRRAEAALAHERAELRALRAALLERQDDATQTWGKADGEASDSSSTSAACSCA